MNLIAIFSLLVIFQCLRKHVRLFRLKSVRNHAIEAFGGIVVSVQVTLMTEHKHLPSRYVMPNRIKEIFSSVFFFGL
jgi:hypothetical protein